MCVCEDRLCVCVWAYVLVYVKRLVFVYVCEGFSYLCVFVKIDCVFVFGVMYLCMLNGSYLCAFVKGVHICVCVCEDRLCVCFRAHVVRMYTLYRYIPWCRTSRVDVKNVVF